MNSEVSVTKCIQHETTIPLDAARNFECKYSSERWQWRIVGGSGRMSVDSRGEFQYFQDISACAIYIYIYIYIIYNGKSH